MAAEGSGSSNVSSGSSDSTVELNIKTLDSQMYTLNVDKNIPVSVFKENVASKTGVPIEQQRLIFRGKVLKDNHLLSEYHVDNGDTLHLVVRQPSQPHSSSGASGGETTAGHDTNAGVPRGRVGQVSHSVLLGTFNVGDQGENSVPDISRVISAVLNSIGVGNQAGVNGGIQPMLMASQGTEAGQRQGTATDQNREVNPMLQTQVPPSQSMPQVMHIPLGAAISIPSINQPIPDSLHTLSEFMNRIELTLSQNGSQPNQPLNNTGVPPPVNLPVNTQGVPTPEALGAVLRHAERLFNDHATGALSHIAGRLEQGSDDPTIRAQIQSESMRVGLVMQHLGALLLELGRTMLTLRMGQSSAESFVNAGPAVYVSSSGPNPIMVQPPPIQTGSLFGGLVAPPMNISGGLGPNPRHVNIHIHAVGPRTATGEGTQGDRGSGNGSVDSGQAHVFPASNIVTPVVPSGPNVVSVSNASHSDGNPSQQSVSSVQLSTIMAGVGSQIRNYLGNMQSEEQGSSARQESSGNQDQPGTGNNDRDHNNRSLLDPTNELPLLGHSFDTESHVAQGEGPKSCNNDDTSMGRAEESLSSSMKGADNQVNLVGGTSSMPRSSQGVAVPLGLGLGGLQTRAPSEIRKVEEKEKHFRTSLRGSKLSKSQGTSGAGATSNTPNDNNQSNRSDELSSQRNTSTLSAGQLAPAGGRVAPIIPMEGLGDGDQNDTANVMSQVLNSPALDGLLAGVSRQTGVGSPDVLRNMLGRLTQNPAMMNTVSQIAQQMDGQDFGSMFGGRTGQGGGMDLSRMVQQMMPMVSQALGGGSGLPQSTPTLEREAQPTSNSTRLNTDENQKDQNSQIDLQQVVQGLKQEDPPEEVFRSVAESVLNSDDYGSSAEGIVNELCAEDGLANEFMEMLRCDLSRRLHSETDSGAEDS